MAHPLEEVMREADGFVIIGDSSKGRFPAMSYHAYTRAKKRFYCLDLGGLESSRGPTKGGKVYTSVDALPGERGDLAIIWVPPDDAVRAVDLAHEAGCRRVWFNFKTATVAAVGRAHEFGMEVVEVGRCPVHFLDDQPGACRAHTLVLKVTGSYRRPPQLDAGARRRELW